MGVSAIISHLFYFLTKTGEVNHNGCLGDGYKIEVNGVIYDQNNQSGVEMFNSVEGCDSMVKINLVFHENVSSIHYYEGCENDGYFIEVNGITYDENNPVGVEILHAANSCDSLVDIVLVFNSCEDVANNCTITLPNIYSPNNDYLNDTFTAFYHEGCQIGYFEIYIFDRWGNKVFYSLDKDFAWDGSFNGNPVLNGIYVWKIMYKQFGYDEIKYLYGDVTLVR